jgi:hypothetical protein
MAANVMNRYATSISLHYPASVAVRRHLLPWKMCAAPKEPECICWRPWPCNACAGGATVFDHLVERHDASRPLQGGTPDEIVEEMTARERAWLVEWVESCPHSTDSTDHLDRLDEGSEHLVYLAPGGEYVLKLTKPGIYGDMYFLSDGLVHRRCTTPGDYLLRLDLIEETFGFAAWALGVTSLGQIVTRQKFVNGDPPTQDEVDRFLLGAGIEPVRQSCWLWRKRDADGEVDYWMGDARADNFVKTPTGIVPIDLRMWSIILADEAAGSG